jgi:hypothetical protein
MVGFRPVDRDIEMFEAAAIKAAVAVLGSSGSISGEVFKMLA